MLRNLSDALPRKVHVTLPSAWGQTTPSRHKESRPPLCCDIPKGERSQVGAVPMARDVPRTLLDCIDAHVSPELVGVALRQARSRGLLEKDDMKRIRARGRAA